MKLVKVQCAAVLFGTRVTLGAADTEKMELPARKKKNCCGVEDEEFWNY